MNLRDLVNKLDAINNLSEADLNDFDTQRKLANLGQLPKTAPVASMGWDSSSEQDTAAQSTMQKTSATQQLASIKQHLFGLLQQLRSYKPATVKESNLEKELLNSFGYELDEAADIKSATKSGILSTLGKKIAWPITAASAIWDAYERIISLPTSLPKDQFKKEVARIIAEVISEYGLFAVGAAIGAALGGSVSGPGGLVTGIAGGFATQWAFGDDADKFVDWLVDQIYPGTSDANVSTPSADMNTTPNTSVEPVAPTTDDSIEVAKEIQTKLQSAGFDIGKAGVDGKIGQDTFSALQAYKKKNNLTTDLDALVKLLALSPQPEKSVSEELGNLRDSLTQIDEAGPPASSYIWRLARKFGKLSPETKAASELERMYGSRFLRGVETVADDGRKQIWRPDPKDPTLTKWINTAENGAQDGTLSISKVLQRARQPAGTPVGDAQRASLERNPTSSFDIPQKPSSNISRKSSSTSKFVDSAKKTGGAIATFLGNHKFLTAIAALGLGGYIWDKYGNLISSKVGGIMPALTPGQGGQPAGQEPAPTSTTQAPGQSTQPAQGDQQLKMLVSSIKADIKELQRITHPEVKVDAQKAIDHAQQTLQIYAPGQ